MKVPFLSQLFDPKPAAAPSPGVPDEPSLQPLGVRARPGAGRQLAQAFAQIADQIAAQEVRDLLDLDTVGCRYQLWTLTFWVTAANQPALRSLVDVNQRDPGVAKALIERNFSKSDNARLLNTLRLKLDFQRGDSLPLDASEVLVVCGRDSVVLPFSYSGQIELGDASLAPRPAGAPQHPTPGTAPGAQTPAGAAASASPTPRPAPCCCGRNCRARAGCSAGNFWPARSTWARQTVPACALTTTMSAVSTWSSARIQPAPGRWKTAAATAATCLTPAAPTPSARCPPASRKPCHRPAHCAWARCRTTHCCTFKCCSRQCSSPPRQTHPAATPTGASPIWQAPRQWPCCPRVVSRGCREHRSAPPRRARQALARCTAAGLAALGRRSSPPSRPWRRRRRCRHGCHHPGARRPRRRQCAGRLGAGLGQPRRPAPPQPGLRRCLLAPSRCRRRPGPGRGRWCHPRRSR